MPRVADRCEHVPVRRLEFDEAGRASGVKAARGRVLRRDLRDKPPAELLRGRSFVRGYPRSLERDQRIVRDEGAVGGPNPDEPRLRALLVQLAQVRLLDVNRM